MPSQEVTSEDDYIHAQKLKRWNAPTQSSLKLKLHQVEEEEETFNFTKPLNQDSSSENLENAEWKIDVEDEDADEVSPDAIPNKCKLEQFYLS